MPRIAVIALSVLATIGALVFIIRFWLLFVVLSVGVGLWFRFSPRGKRMFSQWRRRSRKSKFRIIDVQNKRDER
ncbi:MAG: hypothetical protein KGO83_04730 [Paenibacillaceae bacterium]|jgi:hypothetical protein|nr:hypothetical protein [Paenibacillaceae bacterium]